MRKIISYVKKIINYNIWMMHYIFCKLKKENVSRIPKCEKKILICGNGPSAGRLDYLHYKSIGYSIMCVNFFAVFNKQQFFELKPEFYCCIDDAIMSDRNSVYRQQRKAFFDTINSIYWQMIFVCGAGDSPLINNQNIIIHRVNRNIYPGNLTNRVFKRYMKNKATCGFQNVIACALYYVITAHAFEVLLTGIENNIHKELIVDENNIVYRQCVHFYGEEKINLIDANEIKKGEIYKYFYFMYKTFYQYNILAEYAKRSGVQVKNLTIDSFVDVFKKEKPEELSYEKK